MEIDQITFIKILHYTVENFIERVKSYFSPEVLDTKKVFREIIKRCELITQRLRAIALHAKTSLENSVIGLSDVKQFLDDRIQKLVYNIILQDFIELAYNGEDDNLSISEGELHNFLYSGAMRDITSFTPSTVEMGGLFNFHMPSYQSVNSVTPVSTFDNNLNCLLLSSQFENSRIQFEDELSELRRISESGFLVSDLNRFNVATILKYESSDAATKTDSKKNEFKHFDDPFAQNGFMDPPISVSPDSDLGILSDISENSDSFLCWEDCLGKFQHDHSYISEVTPEAALSNISEKEYQIYYSLINPNDAISEEYMVHDILDLLIGVPSNTFYYDIHARRFKMKYGIHLLNLSPECTAKVVANFIEAGSIYYALQKFSKDFVHSSEGRVFKGMQHGIQLILSMYKEYIIAVKVNRPTMLFLQSDVLKNAELLMSFGVNCGIDPEKMIFCDIPKGLGLLSYLHDIARSHRRKENGIMIAVLLKYSYEPYFSFLNEWMTEGVCNDPYGEFQIMEDLNYLNRRDALYWKFAYTENIDDPSRVVPPEIKHYSQGILDCGKSIGMLKICCPELSSLKFLTCEAVPSLSMVYSFPASIQKLNDCMDYSRFEENSDMVASLTTSDVSSDQFLVESQNFVDRKTMFKLMKRRYNLILAGMITESNVLDFKKMFHHIKNYQSISDAKNKSLNYSNKCSCIPVSVCDGAVLKGCLFRNVGPLFSSYTLKCLDPNFPSNSTLQQHLVHLLSSSKEDNFSGKMYSKVGTLFSSCGYIERDLCDSLSKDIELNFTSLDFGQQLRLISYNQYPCLPVNEECKQMFASEIQYLTQFDKCGLLWQKQNCSTIKKSESCYSKNKDFERKLPVPIPIHSRNLGKAYIADSCNDNTVLNSFLDKLASLLISEYGDTIDDIYSCIQVTSLQRLMMHNFNAVLKMRIHLTEKVIMKFIVKQLGLDLLLSTLRDIYFFQDETFNQTLCEPLFSLVMKCRTPREFANWAVLNEILMNAISSSKFENSPFAASINANVAYIPEDMPIERTDFLHLFVIEFEVKWPLNIIVHQACLQQYLKIFSVLLEIEFLCWMLGRIWRKLTVTCKNLHLDDAPQFRQVMLKRFDMDQFIRVIRNSIHQHLQGPLWEYLTKNLSAEESSIDTLENIHMQYLEKALARCFLTDETNVLHQLLFTMCHQIYKFCSAISECVWEINEETGQYETYVFKGLSAAFDTYKQYQKVFLKLWLQNTLMVDRYNEGDINKKVWTLLGQRLSGFPGDSFRDRKKY